MTLQQNTTIIQATALNFSYPDQRLFVNFSVSIAAGITLVQGGDGRGKTTLLRLLAGELPANSGQLYMNGADLQTQPANYKSKVFFADPRSDVFDQITALDYFEQQRANFADFDNDALVHLTSGLGLQEHLHKQLFMLSTGSKRKVFLAAAFASSAPLTLFDEPFAALDAASAAFVLRWLENSPAKNSRAWVVADYVAPGLALSQVINLGD